MTPEAFVEALKQHGITLTTQQVAQFDTYYTYLVEENEKMNLTGITERDAVYLKHFYDSLTLAFEVPALQTDVLSLCDVGSGAGFPSIPLKIAFPQLQITIVDSLNKRIEFLNRLVAKLDLEGVALYHDRAETFGGKRSAHRAQYDFVTARAVAPLNILAELCLPLAKLHGHFVAMKAAQTDTELAQAETALELLGGRVVADELVTLPESGDERHILMIEKIKQTPGRYPRKPGTPNKQPLGGEA
ncbi:16S rRNA (guanine(527)-N(7))-methyltransferase RsmG [Lacticaseibacillus saniviri]|uniref:Ribosomal RNA small subunit methyltransferase G n=1 Tax=Lacticaseibacillus saniviri JCM 17471 = DSM 24301 TaxID=1293598 RepID=A0A0R2MU71_9LACO|nr:16S rRNA (guanine(527)-N(7))-methyltransferase RsmG [Lacticaseibacillus saniviri]KRO16396.1 glucose-inhibited division protein B [Lacticaseibacillus saniviri JCM 17471 = DSM 24301]MCG4281064.1 16S rRNA (guanine(527)-N(7))-methyltransferase RsmG [Lacticaseibacillus saniviri]